MVRFLTFIIAGLISFPAIAGVVVIVNPGVGISSISKADLSDLYYKKKTAFSDGTAAVPFDQSLKSLDRKAFSKTYMGKKAVKVAKFWKMAVTMGEGTPPQVIGDADDLVAKVASTAGAIGYVDGDTGLDGVKKIKVTD